MYKTVFKAGRRALLVFGFLAIAAACVPYFTGTTAATVEDVGGVLTLRWSTAVDDDTGGFVDYYNIDINGTVATVNGPAIACELSGLTSGSSYTIDITAYDNVGDWSGIIGGTVANLGTVSTTHVAATAGTGGATPTCTPLTDTDGDRLPDLFETNTGTYVDEGDTGTDPLQSDTDGDSISDGDEVLGTVDGLYLPAFGVSPLRQDILLEFDWFDDNAEPAVCGAHSHQPTAAIAAQYSAAFATAPVLNPDGSSGIHVVSDYGQDAGFGPHSGGNLVPDADGVIAGGVSSGDYQSIKAANFATKRNGYFHYTLLPHRYGTNSTSSGQAEVNGDDMIVSLYCYGSTGNVAKTVMHELGHNIGLRHGGDEDRNRKPNYNSIMSYRYQFPGVDTNCDVDGDGLLDYSHGTYASLDENNLDETVGVCGGVGIDWNVDGDTVDIGLSAEINEDASLNVLTDHDDWGNLFLAGILDADGANPIGRSTVEIVTEQPVPVD